MKTILKLAFLGIIAGGSIKFLNEKDVDVIQTVHQAFEWAEHKVNSLGEEIILPKESSDEIAEAQPDVENYSPAQDQVNDSHNGSKIDRPSRTEKKAKIDLTETGVTAIEHPIPQKTDTNKSRFAELDQYVSSVPASVAYDMDQLINYLVQPAENMLERTRLIFSWIAFNVSYDDYGYNTGNYSDVSADGVFRNRRSVCQGFSELFRVMGGKAGLKIVQVIGYSKGISYRPGQSFKDTNHAWNLVYLDGRWRLFDVTWAEGYGTAQNGRLVSIKKYNDYWFDTPADEFIFTHLPEDPKWQMSSISLTKEEFERLPYASSSFFRLGFEGTKCLKEASRGTLVSFPETYLNDGSVRALSLPYQKEIEAHQPFTIRITSDTEADIAVINNGEWIHLRKNGNEYMAVIDPQPGELSVNASLSHQSHAYKTLLSYQVN